MTIRELRQMLTHCENQQMTIQELRNILFEEMDQDMELTMPHIQSLTTKSDETVYYQVMTANGVWSEIRSYTCKTVADYSRVMNILHSDEHYHIV